MSVEQDLIERLKQQAALVPDLAMLVRRLAYQLRSQEHSGAIKLAEQAMEFLRKHNLEGSPLR